MRTVCYIYYIYDNFNTFIFKFQQNIGATVDNLIMTVETPGDSPPLLQNKMLTPGGSDKFYSMAIAEVSDQCFRKAVTEPLQQQNEAISSYYEAQKRNPNLKRKRTPDVVLTNPSTTVGCVVDIQVINSLRITHTRKVDKKQREEDAGKNKLVKKGSDAFFNDQILTNFKLTYPTCGLWRNETLEKIKPLAKCCGISVTLNKQPMILAINAKMNSLLNLQLP